MGWFGSKTSASQPGRQNTIEKKPILSKPGMGAGAGAGNNGYGGDPFAGPAVNNDAEHYHVDDLNEPFEPMPSNDRKNAVPSRGDTFLNTPYGVDDNDD